MRKFSILFIIVGLAFLVVGGYQFFQTKQAQGQSLAEAKSMLEEKRKKYNNTSGTNDFLDFDVNSFSPEKGNEVGILSIPKLDSEIAIIEGTHEDELEQGVGHYNGTAYPLQNDQIVLSGHRDTVFRRMGELDIGDIFVMELEYGDFAYEIVETKIVDAEDRSIIVPTAPDEILTVTTCYPFSYVGSAPDRYILNAVPVEQTNDD